MPGKTPYKKGAAPVKNDINDSKKDDAKSSVKGGKGKKAKEGAEEEMTVVVPPSKGSKLSALPPKDGDEDVDMDGSAESGEDAGAVEVDPVVKAVAGKSSIIQHSIAIDQQILTCNLFSQTSRAISHY